MKRILFFFVAILLVFSSCNINDLLNLVEVSYDVDFDPTENAEATITYYKPNNEIVSEVIEPGSWTWNGIFSEGDQTGVWVSTDAVKGYVGVYLTAWYSELNDMDDHVDAWTWALPQSEDMGFEHIISKTKCYNTNYSVTVNGTNGVPVEIQYSEADYDSQSLLAEATHTDGLWSYSECFPEGRYASLTVSSGATSGTAVLKISIDYEDKDDIEETLTIDFSTATKSGSLGFPVE